MNSRDHDLLFDLWFGAQRIAWYGRPAEGTEISEMMRTASRIMDTMVSGEVSGDQRYGKMVDDLIAENKRLQTDIDRIKILLQNQDRNQQIMASRMIAISEDVSGLSNLFQEVNSRIDSVETDVGNVFDTIEELESDIEVLDENVGEMEPTVEDLARRVLGED